MTSPRVLLAAILLTAVALRLPGAFWGLASQERLQVDETQHVGIALDVINRVDAATVPDDLVTSQWNARALGVQIALVGYPLLRLLPLDLYYLYPIGRGLVLVYAVGLVLVVYRFTMGLARRPAAALLAAALLAVFDLEATYGHIVDSGAIYSFVPRPVLERLGIVPHARQRFRLVDGSMIERDRADALFFYGGQRGAAPVIFAEPGDATLLGAVTLESLGLALDAIRRDLVPLPMIIARAVVRNAGYRECLC